MTRLPFAALALLTTIGGAAAGQRTARVPVAAESRLWIDGTSNLHDWSCKAQTLDAMVELDAAAASQVALAPTRALERVEVKVPVKSLKCGHDAMDNNLYKALKADATPEITYIMATFEATPGTVKDTFTMHATGDLEIAGTRRQIALDVTATRLTDGTVRATGVVPIRMTDYGIKPPTAILGRLKTGDQVKVNFELVIGAKAIATALAAQP
jgi:polyisoprenoid-binding protein YceI